MLELKEIRNNVNNISVIEKISIQKLSYRKIEYNISFYGDFKILSKLLNVNKLKVNNINNKCEIKLKWKNKKVLVPNDPQIKESANRRKNGIPVSSEIYKLLND